MISQTESNKTLITEPKEFKKREIKTKKYI